LEGVILAWELVFHQQSYVTENFLILIKTVIKAISFCSAYFFALYVKIRIDSDLVFSGYTF